LTDREAGRLEASLQPREPVAEVRDLEANGVPCRLYRPDRAALPRAGVIVHLHGGGFVFNDVEVHDAPCRRLANRTGMSVLSVDYRLAPEHPFPAAVEDVDAVVAWLAEQPGTGPLFVHGDSAGGNLALVAALRNPGRFDAVVLLYPFLDPTSRFPSYQMETTWDREEAQWYWQQYAPGADPAHPDLAPLNSEHLGTLPPTLVITAELDIVRDEGEHLACVLKRHGVAVQATRYLAVPHAFWRRFEEHPESDLAMRQVGGFLAGIDGGA
jgi:acetyl esterase